jgi:hypothetical protein
MIHVIKGLLSGGKSAFMHCAANGHTWDACKGTVWSEVRACSICGRVEERQIRGELVFPWKRLRCERRQPS